MNHFKKLKEISSADGQLKINFLKFTWGIAESLQNLTSG